MDCVKNTRANVERLKDFRKKHPINGSIECYLNSKFIFQALNSSDQTKPSNKSVELEWVDYS